MDEFYKDRKCEGDKEYEGLVSGLWKETKLLMVDGCQCQWGCDLGLCLVWWQIDDMSTWSHWACVLVPV